ncbi:MAG TPA: asparagine synthase-related protein [Longimicrobium sp.]|jgi:asparagine synthase (glutamine-hydrolysing)
MSAFVCAAGPDPSLPGDLARRLRRTGTPVDATLAADGFAGAAGPPFLRPLTARRGSLAAVGDVRLDNRAEVLRGAGPVAADAPDLEVALAAFEARGPAAVPALLGDFAFVVWDGRARRLVAARDAFGVRPLFHASVGGTLLVSSRLEALAEGAGFDEAFVSGFLAGGLADPERTVWEGRRAVPPGGILVHEDGRTEVRRYWRAEDFRPAEAADEREAVERFRALFAEAVRCRLTGGPDTWSQLSGGLDSSSVVCMAQALAAAGEVPGGVGGTVTVVDSLGDGDETRFSGAVLRRWGVRNETLCDPWPWEDDGAPPVAADEPRPHFPYWTRDRRLCDAVRRAGGRVLLSGQGSDHYLAGPLTFLADLLARGRVREAAREATRHAVAQRISFYGVFGREALLPLLPRPLARRLEPATVPPWVEPAFARRTGMRERTPEARRALSRRGRVWADEIGAGLAALAGFLERGPFQEGLEMRYPFLHRPLVELGLGLPVALRTRPGTTKWVLREAMRGVLPEEVRARRGKGGIDARVLWALQREAPRLRALLVDPLVARAGWVRADALRAAVERARQGEVENLPHLLCTLALETWLVVRSGRWYPREAMQPAAAASAA